MPDTLLHSILSGDTMNNYKYPWHSAHSNELQKSNRERYATLKAQGLCVLCGEKSATIKTLGEGPEAKFLKYCQECRAQYNINRSQKRLKNKVEVLSHYGPNNVLGCCWEGCTVVDPDMLSLDHLYNTGSEDRKTNPGGVMFYAKVRRNGFPEGFQTLCHNHQWKKEILRRRADLNGMPTWKKVSQPT